MTDPTPATPTDGLPEGSEPAQTPSGESASSAGPAGPDPLLLQIAEALQAADQWKDQLLRKAAEFENYKRRTEAEYASLIRSASENLIFALLPVLDDFDRTLKAGRETNDAASLLRGIELVRAKFGKILEGQGLAPFDSTGTPFDVNLHDALLSLPRADVPPHTVIEEVEKGYRLNGRVLRHAKVVVSAEAGETGTGDGSTTGESNG